MKAIAFVLLTWAGLAVRGGHPIHVGLTNIEYNSSSKAFEVTFKLFTDDFEEHIKQKYGTALNLGKENENSEALVHVHTYIKSNFVLYINGKNKSRNGMVFNRKEQNAEAIWLFYTLPFKGEIAQVKIYNSILCDKFEDQTNLVFFTFHNKEEAFRLDCTVREKTLAL